MSALRMNSEGPLAEPQLDAAAARPRALESGVSRAGAAMRAEPIGRATGRL